jgi:hypothetical protein
MPNICVHSAALICVECDAQLVGIESCPDPLAHRRSNSLSVSDRLFGGQQPPFRTFYEMSPDGYALLPFRRYDGAVREYECLLPYRAPGQSELPWMTRKTIFDEDDVLFVSGMGPQAYKDKSASLPGRTNDYARQYDAHTFIREYIFGDMVRTASWRRRRTNRRHHCIHD